jgi:hypothetical protein
VPVPVPVPVPWPQIGEIAAPPVPVPVPVPSPVPWPQFGKIGASTARATIVSSAMHQGSPRG